METIKRKFHTDSGHGWLAVKIKELRELGILDEISQSSYINNLTVYLEEDRDAVLYVKKLDELGYKVEPIMCRDYDISPIRGYERFCTFLTEGV